MLRDVLEFLLPLLAYLAATVLLVRFLVHGRQAERRWGLRALSGGGLLQLLGTGLVGVLGPRQGFRLWPEGLALVALVLALAFFVPRLRRAAAVGAFVAPLAASFVLVALLGRVFASWREEASGALLAVHVALNLLGIAAFALAAAAAAAYVLQDRNLRTKRLGGPFSRLPPLDVLDALGLRFVVAGFPLLTLGIATGSVFAIENAQRYGGFSPLYALALVAWVLFATVLTLRLLVGWRGRRAAIGTILGFLCTVLVLFGYVVRGLLHGGGAT